MNKKLIFAIIVAGFSSILTQIVILRESISGFYSNELLLGVILGNWLLMVGIGSYLGKYAFKFRDKIRVYIFTQLLIVIFSVIIVFLIRVIRNFIAVPGELISLPVVFFYSFLILFPFCFLHGFQFPLMSFIFSQAKNEKSFQIGKVYIFDNLGDLLGGFVFSYFLVFIFNSFQAIYLVVFLNLISAFILSRIKQRKSKISMDLKTSFSNIQYKKSINKKINNKLLLKNKILNKKIKYGIIVLTIFFISFFSFFDLQSISTKMQYPNQKVIFDENSIYGNLVVTESYKQLNFYENGFLLFNTLNIFANEETVHYALLQAGKVENVLLVSGGVSGTVKEILKYNAEIDYIELDPLIIEAGKKYTDNLDSGKIKIYNIDGRLFVKKTNKKYDAVIIDLPDPSSVQINRFYTLEFFKEIKNILNNNGIVSLSLKGSENYLSKEGKELNAAIYQTLNKIFKNIIIIPGDVNYFVASDKVLDYEYLEKLKEKNIETEYIQNYISEKITKTRIEQINNAVKSKARINEDFKPISHYYYLNYWLSLFNLNYNFIIILIIILLLIILYIIKLKPVPFSIFVTGFSGVSLEVIIIVAFQILYGYVYRQIGIIMAMFMLGLLIGAYFSNKIIKDKKLNNKTLSRFDFLMVLYAILLPLIIISLNKINEKLFLFLSAQILISLLTILIGVLVGIEFPIALKLHLKKKVGEIGLLYGVDLAGACIGAYLVSVLLIPLLGIVNVSLIVGGLNLLSGVWLWVRK